MKVQDTVRCAVDAAKFHVTVDKMREAMGIPLNENPVQAVEELADRFLLTQNERGDVLRQLFMGGDNSRYGLINAVTAASKLADSYERGELLALPVPQRIAVREHNVTPLRKCLARA